MIARFYGQYQFLSNFDMRRFMVDGVMWPSVETFFQFHKKLGALKAPSQDDLVYLVRMHGDKEVITYWTDLGPRDAKSAGRSVKLPANWEQIKVSVMLKGLRGKFSYIEEYTQKLLSTGDEELVEGNTWHDNEWGMCSCANCRNRPHYNKLGMALMQVREELRSGLVSASLS